MQVPPDAPMSARVGAWFGPEVLASAIAVPVVLVGVLVFVLARGSGQPSAVVPPVSTGSPTPASSTAPPPSTAADTATARAVLQLVDQLLAAQSDLAAAVEQRRPVAQDIADGLRNVNATLVTLEQPLAELARDVRAANLADRIVAVSDATREAVTRTQRASITNVAAYKAGGRKVVDVMEPLVAIRAALVVIVAAPGAP